MIIKALRDALVFTKDSFLKILKASRTYPPTKHLKEAFQLKIRFFERLRSGSH